MNPAQKLLSGSSLISFIFGEQRRDEYGIASRGDRLGICSIWQFEVVFTVSEVIQFRRMCEEHSKTQICFP